VEVVEEDLEVGVIEKVATSTSPMVLCMMEENVQGILLEGDLNMCLFLIFGMKVFHTILRN
jgi:hypothetical protein